ncbi:hypothetical protein H0H81_003688 [Sphagnurus paluster]|uniref:F-box domain-containing protein n=1 Tax=Sphagnurus paluster TaxID=117069 RepID=A0A9P7FSB2_9AGAR|nr:hypothetical protein H0H81_003688 [Sphagnurus paluster]
MAALSTLPHDLLLEIFDRFDLPTLYRLSETCRALRQPSKALISKVHLSHLQSLAYADTLAFSGRLVKDLFADATVAPRLLMLTIQHDSRLFEDLEAFRSLLLRCDRVDLVILRLAPDEDLTSPSLDFGHRWRLLFVEILNIVASKPQAKRMVEGGSGWKSMGWSFHYELHTVSRQQSPQARPTQALTTRPEYPSTLPQLFHPLFRLLKGITARLKCHTKPKPPAMREQLYSEMHLASSLLQKWEIHKTTLSPPILPLLEEFRIQSHILSRSPFLDWTVNVLNWSPIKSLCFHLTHRGWEHILSLITLPHLTTLALGSSGIAFPDIQAFLARHPSISTFHLSGPAPLGYLTPHSSAHLLPQLHTLIAGPEYLCHFLAPMHAFPHLQSITLTEERMRHCGQDFQRPVLDLIAQRPQCSIALTLPLPLSS